jgi:hypothetical protein
MELPDIVARSPSLHTSCHLSNSISTPTPVFKIGFCRITALRRIKSAAKAMSHATVYISKDILDHNLMMSFKQPSFEESGYGAGLRNLLRKRAQSATYSSVC